MGFKLWYHTQDIIMEGISVVVANGNIESSCSLIGQLRACANASHARSKSTI